MPYICLQLHYNELGSVYILSINVKYAELKLNLTDNKASVRGLKILE